MVFAKISGVLIIATLVSNPILAADEQVVTRNDAAARASHIIKNGETKALHHHYAAAQQLFDAALKLQPESTQAYLDRGDLFLRMGKNAEAIADFDKALALLDSLGQQHSHLQHKLKLARGKAMHSLKKYDSAVSDFSDAIAHTPSTDGFMSRAAAYEALGDSQKAIADLESAIKVDPSDARVVRQRAQHYRHHGQYQEALADFEKAESLDPSLTAEHYFDRGMVYEDMDQHRRAIEDFDKAIALDHQVPDFYSHRGSSYFGVCDYKKAIADFTSAIALNPHDPELFFKRAEAFSEDGNKQKALEDFNLAVSIKPEGTYLQRRGLLESELGDHAKAIADLSLAIKTNSEDAEYFLDRGLEESATGQYQMALEDLSKGIALKPESAVAYKNRAEAKAKLGDKSGAIQDLSKSASLYESEGDRHGMLEVDRLLAALKK